MTHTITRRPRKKYRLVVDTGVLVSAFVFGGNPAKAVRKAFHEADICVSPELLSEYRTVPMELKSKGKINHTQFEVLIASIAAFVVAAVLVKPSRKLSICRDPKDDMLIECCIAGKARLLISGDKDLLELQKLPFDLKIITPRIYLETVIDLS